MYRSAKYILLIPLFIIGCDVKEVSYEYNDSDPNSPNFIALHPAITGSGIKEEKYPVIMIKAGTLFSGGIIVEKSNSEIPEFTETAIIEENPQEFVDRSGHYSPWLKYRISNVKKRPETDFNENQILKFDLGSIAVDSTDKPGTIIQWQNSVKIKHNTIIDYRELNENDTDWSHPLLIPVGVRQINPMDIIPGHMGMLRIRAIAETDGVSSVVSEVSRAYYTSGISEATFISGNEVEVEFQLVKTGNFRDGHILYVTDDAGYWAEIGRAGRDDFSITGYYNFRTGHSYRFKIVTLYQGKQGHSIIRDQVVVGLDPPVIQRVNHIDNNTIEVLASLDKDFEGEMLLKVNTGSSVQNVFSTRVSGRTMVFHVTGLPGGGSVNLSAGNEAIGYSAGYHVSFNFTLTNTGVLALTSDPEWMAMSGDRSVIVLVHTDGASTRMEVYNAATFTKTGDYALPFEGLQGVPWSINFDGTMAVVGYSLKIHLIDLRTGDRIEYTPPRPNQLAGITRICYISRERNVVLYANGNNIMVYDLENEEVLQHVSSGLSQPRSMEADYYYEYVAIDWPGVIRIYSVEDERIVYRLGITNQGILPVFRAFKSNDNTLIQRLVTSTYMINYREPPYDSFWSYINRGFRINDEIYVDTYGRELRIRSGSNTINTFHLPEDFGQGIALANDPYQSTLYHLIKFGNKSGGLLVRLRYGRQRYLYNSGYPLIFDDY